MFSIGQTALNNFISVFLVCPKPWDIYYSVLFR